MRSNRRSRMLRTGGPLLLVFCMAVSARAQGVLAPEASQEEVQWVQQRLERSFAQPRANAERQASEIPFSFVCDGRPSSECLLEWEYTAERKAIPSGSQETIRYKDPKSGLVLECEITRHDDFPAVDWVFHWTNTGTADSPLLERFLPLDCGNLLSLGSEAEAVTLRWSNGDSWSSTPTSAEVNSFIPHDEPLIVGQTKRFAPTGGRSSHHSGFPFFNLAGPNQGWIVAIGWTGQWAAEFVRETPQRVVVRAGMETTRFRLHPGERVRSPRIALLHYTGPEMIVGHNQFRRLLMEHYVPRVDGKPIRPPVALNTVAGLYLRPARKTPGSERLSETTERQAIALIEKLGGEAYWMDAYWFGEVQNWWAGVGTWQPRLADFPQGLRPLADAAHQAGQQFILWFEPERAAPRSQFDLEHPEFLLKNEEAGDRLFDLGNPQGLAFLIDFLDTRIKQWKVDVYRQDFNFDPLPFWKKHDTEDRQGVTEMHHVEGLYQLWSELVRRNPGLVIDNCASGGRRIDFETISRSYALWRSDMNDIPEGLKDRAYWPMMGRNDQVISSGLSLYYPLHTGSIWDMRPYCFRSSMTQGIVFYNDFEDPQFPVAEAQQGIAELKSLRPLFVGDFYPLLPITTSQADWYAYQLDRPDLGQGCALVFRRPENEETAREIRLQHLDPEAQYTVTITGETYAKGPTRSMRGRELMALKVEIPEKPGSVLLEYRRAKP